MRIIGIDPGLRHTGYGIIEKQGSRLIYVAAGTIDPSPDLDLSKRLAILYDELKIVIEMHQPDRAAVEETFVNMNPKSTLKLGQARGIALLVPASLGLPVFEYTPNTIKKNVTGVGHAEKQQVQLMVKTLLSGYQPPKKADADDALAIAICDAFLAR